uniref:Uncharacterized protein n=1 Tax=Rhizophora mucronata TaxID=61149 RepID=A0A2P2J4A8_RHIMU
MTNSDRIFVVWPRQILNITPFSFGDTEVMLKQVADKA